MSKVFRSYTRSEDVVMIPDMPEPPALQEEEANADFPAEDIKEKAGQILAEAEAQAQQALEDARLSAGQEREQLLAAAQAEARQLCEQARREGAEQGKREKQQEISNALQGLAVSITQLRQSQEDFLRETEQGLKLLAVDIAEKLIDKKIEEDDAVLVGLVRKAVQSIRDADWITVEVSANLPQLTQTLENELGRESANGARLEFALRDMPDSDCWVQTPDGALDASLSTQLANLREIFSHMDEA